MSKFVFSSRVDDVTERTFMDAVKRHEFAKWLSDYEWNEGYGHDFGCTVRLSHTMLRSIFQNDERDAMKQIPLQELKLAAGYMGSFESVHWYMTHCCVPETDIATMFQGACWGGNVAIMEYCKRMGFTKFALGLEYAFQCQTPRSIDWLLSNDVVLSDRARLLKVAIENNHAWALDVPEVVKVTSEHVSWSNTRKMFEKLACRCPEYDRTLVANVFCKNNQWNMISMFGLRPDDEMLLETADQDNLSYILVGFPHLKHQLFEKALTHDFFSPVKAMILEGMTIAPEQWSMMKAGMAHLCMTLVPIRTPETNEWFHRLVDHPKFEYFELKQVCMHAMDDSPWRFLSMEEVKKAMASGIRLSLEQFKAMDVQTKLSSTSEFVSSDLFDDPYAVASYALQRAVTVSYFPYDFEIWFDLCQRLIRGLDHSRITLPDIESIPGCILELLDIELSDEAILNDHVPFKFWKQVRSPETKRRLMKRCTPSKIPKEWIPLIDAEFLQDSLENDQFKRFQQFVTLAEFPCLPEWLMLIHTPANASWLIRHGHIHPKDLDVPEAYPPSIREIISFYH